MVRQLASPQRPLRGGHTWTWHALDSFPDPEQENQTHWIRVFHVDDHCPSPTTRRTHGPLYRFDHHTIDHDDPATDHTEPTPVARQCPNGRSIIYLARSLRTALAEVFDDASQGVCPNYRVAALYVTGDCIVQDLTGHRSLSLGALPALGSGNEPRPLTQRWARAIYEDDPAGVSVDGVLYNSAHDQGLCLALFNRAPRLTEVVNASLNAGGLPLLDIKNRVSTAMKDVRMPFREVDAKECKKCSERL